MILEGAFLDSPVEGLGYWTETQSGVTDAEGRFMYMEGETVIFHVGDIVLGEAPAQPVMTPLDLVEGAMDETHPMATNIVRFLLTMDADMDPSNGITILEEVSEQMYDHTIDFEMDPDVQSCMDTLNDMNLFDHMLMMVSIEDAQEHFRGTLNSMMSDHGNMMGSADGMM
jgi:hypothetical protein